MLLPLLPPPLPPLLPLLLLLLPLLPPLPLLSISRLMRSLLHFVSSRFAYSYVYLADEANPKINQNADTRFKGQHISPHAVTILPTLHLVLLHFFFYKKMSIVGLLVKAIMACSEFKVLTALCARRCMWAVLHTLSSVKSS